MQNSVPMLAWVQNSSYGTLPWLCCRALRPAVPAAAKWSPCTRHACSQAAACFTQEVEAGRCCMDEEREEGRVAKR